MSLRSLIRSDVTHFWQTNLAVVAGVGVAVAVLAGALLVGASVRGSLRALAVERLGAVDMVVTSLNFVPEERADALIAAAPDRLSFGDALPLIAVEGFVTHQSSGRRASAVQVYGVDERFWQFHGVESSDLSLERNGVFVSPGLARELEAAADDALLVRVAMPSAVPISSLHGRKDDLGRTLRLTVQRVLVPEEQGEFSFRPQQGLARSVFVPLTRLQQEIEQEGRVNTFLLSEPPTAMVERDQAARLAAAEDALREVATLDDIGLEVRDLPDRGVFSLEAAAGLVNDATVDAVQSTAARLGLGVEPVMTYLANEIRHGDLVTPYSLVAGLDLELVTTRDPMTDADQEFIPVVLNQWAADDLAAAPGDDLELVYHLWEDEGRLVTRETTLRVIDVVPIEGAAADPALAPDYPGITEATDLASWDPPFEFDLGLIRPKDEDYWDEYGMTPKVFLSLEAAQRLWASRWGALTSVRLRPEGDVVTEADRFRTELGVTIDPLAVGFVVYPARALALESSSGATDFGLYFIYFSFFLVVSALLLASLFFRLGVEQRLAQIGLLRATGYPPSAIWRLFTIEALVLATVGGLVGVAGAVGYAEFIMWGLRTWWVGAVGTTRLSLHVAPEWLLVGAGGGVAAAVGSITWTLRSLIPVPPRSLLAGVVPEVASPVTRAGISRATSIAVACGLVGMMLVGVAAADVMSATAGFFGGGLLLLAAMLAGAWAWLHAASHRTTRDPWSVSQIGFRNATSRPGRSVLCIALIASATFIIVAVDAFHRAGGGDPLDPTSGTGGYTLLADTLLPIAHDLSTPAGRDALFLTDLYDPGEPLAGVNLSRFRVRPGEDASCLNLYQAKDPRILAPTDAFVAEARFSFASSLAETDAEVANPWLLLDRVFDDGAIPAIADATSLAYALHLKVGDDFLLNRDTDRPIRLRIVAALVDSIFQRELLIGETAFQRVFPDYDGYRFFLADAAPEQTGVVSAALEDRLADFGFDVVSASERLALFHQVENTYLATFQTLGGLGLVLGTLGLGAVLLRNVLERRRELALLRAVGYNAGHLSLMVVAENAFLLGAGLVAGTVCALVAIAPAWLERGGGLPILSLSILLVSVVVVGFVASLAATLVAVRSPLLAALRTE